MKWRGRLEEEKANSSELQPPAKRARRVGEGGWVALSSRRRFCRALVWGQTGDSIHLGHLKGLNTKTRKMKHPLKF